MGAVQNSLRLKNHFAPTHQLFFFGPDYINFSPTCMGNRTDFCIDLFAFTIRSPAWETAPKTVSPSRNPYDFDPFLGCNSQIDARLHRSSNGYASMGTDLLFAFIFTADHRITRAILERHHARVTSELFLSEVFTSVFFQMFVWFHMVCTKLYEVPTHISTTTIHDPNLQQYLYNSTVPYIHRSALISHIFLPALRSTLAARDLYCTPGTSMNCTDISTL